MPQRQPHTADAADRGRPHRAGRPRVIVGHDWAAPTANPYVRQLCDALQDAGIEVVVQRRSAQLRGRFDVLHLHWPESALRHPATARAALAVVSDLAFCAWRRLRGTTIVWTAHNLAHHERRHRRLEAVFWRLLVRLVQRVIFLDHAGQRRAYERFPRLRARPATVVRHGHYRDAYPPAPPRQEARRDLRLAGDAPTLLFFGQVRPYKNVHGLLEVFRRWDRPDATLMVAGRARDPGYRARITAAAARDRRVRLRCDHVPDDAVGTLFAAADLVVLPFERVLNSGSVMLALSFARPVLVPRTESFVELGRLVGAGWIHCYEPPLSVGDITAATAAARRVGTAAPDLTAFTWEGIARATRTAYGLDEAAP